MEPVDTSDLKSDAFGHAGSSPAILTKIVVGALALLLAGCAGSGPQTPHPVIGSFGDFTPPDGYAHALACPKDYCNAEADLISPVMKISAEKLRNTMRQALDAEPRLTLLRVEKEGLRLVYQSRSIWGDSSTVTAEIADADVGESSVIVYSQSDSPGGSAAAQRSKVHGLIEDILDAIH